MLVLSVTKRTWNKIINVVSCKGFTICYSTLSQWGCFAFAKQLIQIIIFLHEVMMFWEASHSIEKRQTCHAQYSQSKLNKQPLETPFKFGDQNQED
jgi:hypothetical protein